MEEEKQRFYQEIADKVYSTPSTSLYTQENPELPLLEEQFYSALSFRERDSKI